MTNVMTKQTIHGRIWELGFRENAIIRLQNANITLILNKGVNAEYQLTYFKPVSDFLLLNLFLLPHTARAKF